MFDKVTRAALLAVGAMAVDKNCCTVFEEEYYEGPSATLCYANTYSTSIFNVIDFGLDRIGSYKCGANTTYSFCNWTFSECEYGTRETYVKHSNFSDSQKWVSMSYYSD